MADFNDPNWWRSAVLYQVYVRSFADSDGDGIGDLPGITSRLEHLRDLGVDGLWITPFFTSPQHDHGYDVADYTDVDPLFGRLSDADDLLARAHELGLKVIFDIVPNHTSNEHAWFQEALAAEPGSPERERYLFLPGKGPDGDEPPNNWDSVFGGPAWTRIEGLRPVVPPPLRPDPAGPELAQPRRARDVRGRAAVLAGPRRRRLPRGRRPLAVQGVGAPRPGQGARGRREDARRLCRRGRGRHGRVEPEGRADVGPAGGPRCLPVLAQDPRLLRADPDVGRRGVDPDAGVDGSLRPPRRAAPGVQLRLAARPLVGHRLPRRGDPHPRRARAPGQLPHLGALQPRRDPAHDPVRRWCPGPGPRAGRDADDAGAAGLVVPLPGRGARPARGRRRAAVPRRTPRGSAPASPGATAAGCRSPGAETPRRSASARATSSPGSRSPPTGRR